MLRASVRRAVLAREAPARGAADGDEVVVGIAHGVVGRAIADLEIDHGFAARIDEVVRVAGIEDAQPGEITFLANPKYASKLAATRASAVIAGEQVNGAPCPILRTQEPYLAFAEAVALLTPARRPAPGISPLAAVDPASSNGATVWTTYLRDWVMWNHVRAVTAIVALGCFIFAWR